MSEQNTPPINPPAEEMIPKSRVEQIVADRVRTIQSERDSFKAAAEQATQFKTQFDQATQQAAALKTQFEEYRTLVRHGITADDASDFIRVGFEKHKSTAPDSTLDQFLAGPARNHPVLRGLFSAQPPATPPASPPPSFNAGTVPGTQPDLGSDAEDARFFASAEFRALPSDKRKEEFNRRKAAAEARAKRPPV